MALELILRFAGGILLILANAFFVITEFALTRTRQFDEEDFQGHPGLERAWKMTEKLEIYLTGCQLGISSSSVLLGIVFEPAVTELIRPVVSLFGVSGGAASAVSITVSVVLINLIHKIWGEQAPTYWGVEEPIKVLRYGAIPLDYWTRVTKPFILLGDGLAKWTLNLFGVTIERSWAEEEVEAENEDASPSESARSDLTSQMSDFLKKQDIPKERRQEVIRTLEIGDTPVREMMVQREDITALSTEIDFEENMARMSESMRSRYPLVGDDVDDYVGNIYVPELLRELDALQKGEKTLKDLAEPPLTIEADTPISKFIDRLQEEQQELALITEEERVVGLVTLTNALEAVFGSAKDPLDVKAGDPAPMAD